MAAARKTPSRTAVAPAAQNGAGARPRFDERRLAVVDAAAHVFAVRGYERTTIDDIVQATGLTRGGLYHYISGKKDLLVASHERYLRPLLETCEEIGARGDAPGEELRALVREMMRLHAAFPDHVAVFLNEWRSIHEEPEWAQLRRDRRAFERIVHRVLERGSAEGDFVVDDVRLTLLALMGMVNYSYQWLDPKGRVDVDDIADRFCDIFLLGIQSGRDGR
ncbi:TetR/AcrR family transcriptional regulator [Baekduia soli]|uniref:TetR/AcrR family transcriptional regulator n=1 Tax=Baekduia soli TaxID=496014 RepID=A0A5B8U9B7_9ACTN|nr:TetR/AcrR family transcriptional regulator [Baekduia soli]QEC49736.1 TetR/AcrR family transcriptional regulator [Baekduia soli]